MDRGTVDRWLKLFWTLTGLCAMAVVAFVAIVIFAEFHEVSWLTPKIFVLFVVGLATLSTMFVHELSALLKYRAIMLLGAQSQGEQGRGDRGEQTEPLVRPHVPVPVHRLAPVQHLASVRHLAPVPQLGSVPAVGVAAVVRPAFPEARTTVELVRPAKPTAVAERPSRPVVGRRRTKIVGSNGGGDERVMQAYLQGLADKEKELLGSGGDEPPSGDCSVA